MRYTNTRTALAITALLVTLGCSGGGGDEATKFVGNWTFNAGSVINATCQPPLQMTLMFDLAGRAVSITKVDNSNIRVFVGQGCSVNFGVSGSTATAGANQLCTLTVTVGGQPMNETIMIDTWTFTLAQGALSTSLSGAVAICTATGSGSLSPTPGGADGGGG